MRNPTYKVELDEFFRNHLVNEAQYSSLFDFLIKKHKNEGRRKITKILFEITEIKISPSTLWNIVKNGYATGEITRDKFNFTGKRGNKKGENGNELKIKTEQQTEIIKEYFKDVTTTCITFAEKYNVSKETIRKIIKKSGKLKTPRKKLKQRKFSNEQRQKTIRQYLEGKLKVKEITKKNNLSKESIYDFLKEEGIKIRRNKLSKNICC